ncbi:hypothetical protein BH09VER1_BH09VER1_00080 [soil metagenome]
MAVQNRGSVAFGKGEYSGIQRPGNVATVRICRNLLAFLQRCRNVMTLLELEHVSLSDMFENPDFDKSLNTFKPKIIFAHDLSGPLNILVSEGCFY